MSLFYFTKSNQTKTIKTKTIMSSASVSIDSVRMLIGIPDPVLRDTVLNDSVPRFLCKVRPNASTEPCADALAIIEIESAVSNFGKGQDVVRNAVIKNHSGCVDLFLQNTVISKNIEIAGLLTLAADCGSADMVKLLASKIDLYPKPEKYVSLYVQSSPLSSACGKGHLDIVRLLLVGTDEPHVRYIKEHAFKEAMKVPHLLIVDLFVESYKQSSTKISTHILEYIQPKVLSELFRKSNILDVLDMADKKTAYFFGTMLVRFASDGEFMGVRFLLDDPRIKLSKGNSAQLDALVGAAECGREDIIRLITSRGTNPFACLDSGYSCDDDDKYYVFKKLLSYDSKCDPSIIMNIFKRAPDPKPYEYDDENSKREVLLLLMKNDKLHEAIVDRLILKEKDDDEDSQDDQSDQNDDDSA